MTTHRVQHPKLGEQLVTHSRCGGYQGAAQGGATASTKTGQTKLSRLQPAQCAVNVPTANARRQTTQLGHILRESINFYLQQTAGVLGGDNQRAQMRELFGSTHFLKYRNHIFRHKVLFKYRSLFGVA